MKKSINVIISGGGTGGHIFPAISIADAIKEKMPDAVMIFILPPSIEILKSRLVNRGREDEAEINKRIKNNNNL